MGFQPQGWGHTPKDFQGLPLDAASRPHIRQASEKVGSAAEHYFALREKPEVLLRVAAFLRKALNRDIELRETSGYLDPYIRMGSVSYSLLRDEGHGLRELVSLLAATYSDDWRLLVVDEPELHLHPAMLRLWLGELNKVCEVTGNSAVVITHEPAAITPKTVDDLRSLWLFQPGGRPSRLSDFIDKEQERGVEGSLLQNPGLVSQLVFAPRPVLVEGILDVAALSVAMGRTQPAEVVAQTELIDCGGSGGVALWFNIASRAGLNFKAIADLDACLDSQVQAVMDRRSDVTQRYRVDLAIEPAKTHVLLRPLIEEMRKEGVSSNPKSRAVWLSSSVPVGTGHESRRAKLLEIWRDAGLWLHSQGTLESVLGTETKSREAVQSAASKPGPIDEVASWAAFVLDPKGDVFELLGAAVERIAQAIQVAQRLNPDAEFSAPVGSSVDTDGQLVHVTPTENGRHRITVKVPQAFAGYYVEFDRTTPPVDMTLLPPVRADE
ncbi:ATP-dependent nuclease [Georgenia wutianyii]